MKHPLGTAGWAKCEGHGVSSHTCFVRARISQRFEQSSDWLFLDTLETELILPHGRHDLIFPWLSAGREIDNEDDNDDESTDEFDNEGEDNDSVEEAKL